MDLQGDEQIRADVFGPGCLSDDVSQSTVDRIIERILPCLTPKWLRIDQLIPVLEKRNFISLDSLSVLKDSKDQTWMFTEIVKENRTFSFLLSLYASLVDSGHTIPVHYRLANEIKGIIQFECRRDGSVHLVKKTMQSQSNVVLYSPNNSRDLSRPETAVTTRSPNNSRELSGTDERRLTDICCGKPDEASRSPNPTGVQNGSTLPHHKEIVPGNNLPPVPKNTSRDSPISQLNDLGPSSSVCQNSFNDASVVPHQNQFSAASVVPPQDQFSLSEFCDPSLLEAFNEPNVDLFACLIQTGAATNLPSHEGSYLLHLAVSGGLDEKIKLLLHHGAAPNVVRATDGKTPLHLACERQSNGYVKRLIECGADVNALDHNGMSCLHLINTLQQPEIVDLLLHHGAHCDIPTKGDYLTPLVIAAGLSSNTVKQSISYLLKAGASVNAVDQSTQRPLVAAAITGAVETVKELINNGANVNSRNKDGMTPLIAAVHTNKKQIVQLLLDRGADMNCIQSGSYTISGNIVLMSGTALCEAAYNGQLDLVKMLREKGALITAKLQEEKAPIVFAVIGGHADVVDYICTGTKLPDNELLEAFVTALELGHNDCAVIVFMKSGGLKDKMMEEARRHGSREIVDLLSRASDSAVQGTSPASSGDTNSPLLEAPQRATLNMADTPSQLENTLFRPVEALPPPRPTFSPTTHHERAYESDGLDFNEGHRQMIDILLEFAQICLRAALDYRDCEWLIDHAKKCHHPHVAQFFSEYYSCDRTAMPERRFLEVFFLGEPSTVNFLIHRSIVTKTRVEKVLNEMGRNHREFFTELMKVFLQFPGTDHLPYDGDLLASHLFNGTIVMGQRYKPSTIPFSSDLPEHQPTMPSVGGHRMDGSTPSPVTQDSQLTIEPNNQQLNRPNSQQNKQLQNDLQAKQQIVPPVVPQSLQTSAQHVTPQLQYIAGPLQNAGGDPLQARAQRTISNGSSPLISLRNDINGSTLSEGSNNFHPEVTVTGHRLGGNMVFTPSDNEGTNNFGGEANPTGHSQSGRPSLPITQDNQKSTQSNNQQLTKLNSQQNSQHPDNQLAKQQSVPPLVQSSPQGSAHNVTHHESQRQLSPQPQLPLQRQPSNPPGELFRPVEALPPPRPTFSPTTHHEKAYEPDRLSFSQGHRHRVIEILYEFAQICLRAALNYRDREWLIDYANKCCHPHVVQFFSEYYAGDGTMEHMPGQRLLEDFFLGEPSTMSFLINRGLITKARVEKVLNEMGRNHREFFTELMKAFHQIPGFKDLPYDGDLFANHLFSGLQQHYKPSTTECRLSGSTPPCQLTSEPTKGGNNQTSNQQLNQLNSQKTAQQDESSQEGAFEFPAEQRHKEVVPGNNLPSVPKDTSRGATVSQDLNECHRQMMKEILLELAQMCLKAAVDYRNCEILIKDATECHYIHVAEFLRKYYNYDVTMVPEQILSDFFEGEPSTMNFLINRGIVSKARVEKVLNEMGRNHQEYFTELMKVFHQLLDNEELPYDGDQLATRLFNGTLDIGWCRKPSSTPLSSELLECQNIMPTTGDHTYLDREPTLADLLDNVAAKIPNKYEQVGIQLGLQPSEIDVIRPVDRSLDSSRRAYTQIFQLWKRRNSLAYTWKTIIDVLKSPNVDEKRVSDDLASWVQMKAESVLSQQSSQQPLQENESNGNPVIQRFVTAKNRLATWFDRIRQ